MKLHFAILCLAFCLFGKTATAQTTSEYSCGYIYYSYDAAGNRTKREVYDCSGGGGEEEKGNVYQDTTQNLMETVFPNPTSGSFTVQFSSTVSSGQVIIYDN